MPEYAAAKAIRDWRSCKKLIMLNIALVLSVLLPGTVLFAFFGPALISIWTKGHVAAEHSFVILMASATVMHGIWYFGNNILLSTNSHVRLSKFIFSTSILSIFFGLIFGKIIGLNGIFLSIMLAELSNCLILVFIVLNKKNIDSFNEELFPENVLG